MKMQFFVDDYLKKREVLGNADFFMGSEDKKKRDEKR